KATIMSHSGKLIVAMSATACLLTAVGTAEAAKGVKKVGGSGSRTVTGRVVNVNYNQAGSGSISLRTAGQHKKQGAGESGGVAGPMAPAGIREFQADKSTRLVMSNGSPASPTALQRGAPVLVQVTGDQATSIQILSNNRTRENFTRHRNLA